MNRVILILLFALLAFKSMAQCNIQEARLKMSRIQNDEQKLSLYTKLFKGCRFDNTDSAISFFSDGYKGFAKRHYELGEAKLMIFLASLYDDQGIGSVAMNNYREGIRLFNKLGLAESAADATNAVGILEAKSGNYNKAIALFLKSLALFERTGHRECIMDTYLKLGTVNEFMGHLDKSLLYYNKALSYSGNDSTSLAAIQLFNNIGVVYCRMNDLDLGIRYLYLALEKDVNNPTNDSRILSLTNLGIAHHLLEQDHRALVFYKEAIALAKKRGMLDDQARLLLNMANLSIPKQKPIELLNEALLIVKGTGHNRLQSEIMQAKVASYKANGNFREALEVFEQLKANQDSINSLERQKEIARLESGHELSTTKQKLSDLIETESRIRQQRNLTIIVAVLLVISLVFLFYILRRQNSLNKRLKLRKTQLDEANTIKNRLFSVISHDLKSPFSNMLYLLDLLIRQQLSGEATSETLQLLRDHVMATYQTMGNLLDWSRVQLEVQVTKSSLFSPRKVIEEQLKLIGNIAERKNVSIVIEIGEEILIFADMQHFRIVMGNLIHNAIKFSFPDSTVIVAVDQQPEWTTITVSDNGKGMDEERQNNLFTSYGDSEEGTLNEKGSGLGLHLIQYFMQLNKGRIWVESAICKGSTFYCAFPNVEN